MKRSSKNVASGISKTLKRTQLEGNALESFIVVDIPEQYFSKIINWWMKQEEINMCDGNNWKALVENLKENVKLVNERSLKDVWIKKINPDLAKFTGVPVRNTPIGTKTDNNVNWNKMGEKLAEARRLLKNKFEPDKVLISEPIHGDRRKPGPSFQAITTMEELQGTLVINPEFKLWQSQRKDPKLSQTVTAVKRSAKIRATSVKDTGNTSDSTKNVLPKGEVLQMRNFEHVDQDKVLDQGSAAENLRPIAVSCTTSELPNEFEADSTNEKCVARDHRADSLVVGTIGQPNKVFSGIRFYMLRPVGNIWEEFHAKANEDFVKFYGGSILLAMPDIDDDEAICIASNDPVCNSNAFCTAGRKIYSLDSLKKLSMSVQQCTVDDFKPYLIKMVENPVGKRITENRNVEQLCAGAEMENQNEGNGLDRTSLAQNNRNQKMNPGMAEEQERMLMQHAAVSEEASNGRTTCLS